MKKNIKYTLKYLLAFIIIICTYMILMTLSSLIPSLALKENVIKSSETLLENGEKIEIDILYKKETMFTFTDALMINTAYSVDNKTPIKSFMLARKNYIPGQTKIEYVDSQYNLGANEKYKDKNGNLFQTKELYALMHGENIEDSYEYARYWHGYLVILRPLLVMFSYSAIRIVLLILMIILVTILLALLYKKIDLTIAIIFIVGLFSIGVFTITNSINESLIFIFTYIVAIILLLKKDKIKDICMFFFIIGSITNFIDLLTAPLISLGIVGTIYFLLMQKEDNNITITKYIKEILKICISWALGYGLTWATKWLLTQVLFDRNLISQAIEQAIYRTKIPKGTDGVLRYTIKSVIDRNLEYLTKNVIFSIITAGVIFVIYNLVRNLKINIDFKSNVKKCIPYIVMFFLPIVWYILLKQHSMIHSFFTYRILMISVINIFVIVRTLFTSH